MIDTAELAAILVQAADTLVTDFDPVDFLHTITEQAARVSGADAVGLMLGDDHGHLQYVASSTRDGQMLEALQLSLSQGPCLDAFSTGRPVVNANLTAEQHRWPTFAPHAVRGGYKSVHAFPLRLRDTTVGAMGMFGRTAVEFASDEITAVQALADIATISILQDRAIDRAETLAAQLQGALDSRIVIEQAKGCISLIAGVSVADAFTMLRDHSRHRGARLIDVAAATIADPRGTAHWWRP